MRSWVYWTCCLMVVPSIVSIILLFLFLRHFIFKEMAHHNFIDIVPIWIPFKPGQLSLPIFLSLLPTLQAFPAIQVCWWWWFLFFSQLTNLERLFWDLQEFSQTFPNFLHPLPSNFICFFYRFDYQSAIRIYMLLRKYLNSLFLSYSTLFLLLFQELFPKCKMKFFYWS